MTRSKVHPSDLKADLDSIKWLFYESGLSVYEIAKRCDLNESQVGKYKNKATPWQNMTFRYASKLTDLAKELGK